MVDKRCWEVNVLLLAWSDIDRVLEGVSAPQAVHQMDGGSSFAWTLAHVTNGIDSWINVRFLGRSPHPLFSRSEFAFGSDGSADNWQEIRDAVDGVRVPAYEFLTNCTAEDLARTVPYDGAHPPFRKHGLNLRMAILQNAIHHMFHVGEIATKRGLLDQEIGIFPGSLIEMSDWEYHGR